MAVRRILALGGHEFSSRPPDRAVCELLLRLASERGTERPRICLLPTASGDTSDQIGRFYAAFGERGCEPSDLSLFRLGRRPMALRDHLLSQDLIYVGGGSMINLLAIWQAHGLDEVLRSCWERGVVLVGQSAGAMCWFDWGVTRSAGQARVVAGLGFLPGIASVHYHRDPDRRRALLDAVSARRQTGYGIDDRAGILFRGRRLTLALTGQELAKAWLAQPSETGVAREAPMDCVALPTPRPAIDEVSADVTELRRLRALRAGRSHRPARFR